MESSGNEIFEVKSEGSTITLLPGLEYFRDEENGCVIRHIRLYYEFVIPAEALTIDQVATGCINEELVNKGLALKKWMIAKVESNVLQWPTSRIALFKFNALTRYIDSEGFLYLVHEKKQPLQS